MKKLLIILMCFSLMLVSCQSNTVESNAEYSVENEVINNETVEETEDVIIEEVAYGDYEGYFWEVTKGDATVYMFGSIHMADESLYPMSEKVEMAFENSDILGVEADISDTSAIQSLISLMMYQGDDTVYNHLSEEGISKFEAICDELGYNPKMLQKFKVWALGSNLLALQLMESPYSAEEGVDMYFIDKAKNINKEIVALEGLEYQMNLINDFTDEQQEAAFLLGLGTTEETVSDFDEMYQLYLNADEVAMTEYLFSGDTGFAEEVEDKMLHDRNILMTEKIVSYLETDKTYFIVVGLAHYLGEDSVINMLKKQGYEVKRK